MYIVRKPQDDYNTGSRYLVEASLTGTKYRLAKVSKLKAKYFSNRKTAKRWADKVDGVVDSFEPEVEPEVEELETEA